MLCRTGSGTGWRATARASGTGAPGNDRVGRGAAMPDSVGGQPARDGHAKQSTDARRARRLSSHGDRVRGYPESADVAAHSGQGRDHCQEAEGWRRRRRGDIEAVGQGTPRRGCRLRSSGVRAVVAEPAHQCSLRHGNHPSWHHGHAAPRVESTTLRVEERSPWPPVTNQVTTVPGDDRHSTTCSDTAIRPTCGNPT